MPIKKWISVISYPFIFYSLYMLYKTKIEVGKRWPQGWAVSALSVFAGSDGTIEINSKSNNQNAEVKDCFETINRGVFAFNQGLDKIFFKPVA